MENELSQTDYSKKIAALKSNAQMQAWIAQYREYEASGLSISAFSKLNGIAVSTFCHRLRRVRETICDQLSAQDSSSSPAIVPVKTIEAKNNNTSSINIVADGFSITLCNDVSAEHLKTIIQALKSC